MSESAYTKRRVECERGLVAIAFKDPAVAIDRVLSIVSPEDFFDRDLAAVYEVLRDLHSAGFRLEVRACAIELEKRGAIDRIGRDALRQMLQADEYPIANAVYYAKEVARLADHRRVIDAADAVAKNRHRLDVEPEELRGKFEVESRVTRLTDEAATLGNAVEAMLAEHSEALRRESSIGMATGFSELDRKTSGLRRQQLWIVGARIGVGKTALALSIAHRMASAKADPMGIKRGVVFFSLEMTKTELAERITADHLGIDYGRFCYTKLEESQVAEIRNCQMEIASWPFIILDRPSQTVEDIRAKAKIYAPDAGLDLIVVDTLQRVRPRRRQDRRLELQQISNDLKDVAKELNCCILLCAQLNAGAEGSEPDMTHFSEGKQITEPADTCILLHRDRRCESMLVKIEKLRRGSPKSFYMSFNGKLQRFTESEAVEASGSQPWQP